MTERPKILIAIHGHQPDRWTDEVRLALTPTPTAHLRVLVVEAAPASSRTAPVRRGFDPVTESPR